MRQEGQEQLARGLAVDEPEQPCGLETQRVMRGIDGQVEHRLGPGKHQVLGARTECNEQAQHVVPRIAVPLCVAGDARDARRVAQQLRGLRLVEHEVLGRQLEVAAVHVRNAQASELAGAALQTLEGVRRLGQRVDALERRERIPLVLREAGLVVPASRQQHAEEEQADRGQEGMKRTTHGRIRGRGSSP